MILDNIENFNKYICLNNNFKKISDYLAEHDLLNMQTGCYEIDGRNLYVNIDEYETKDSSIPEAHRQYIDVQIVLDGHEKIGYANVNCGKSEIDYNAEKDIEFLSADCEYLKAYKGRFFIFYPQDIHQPCITDEEKSKVKKAVFKIKL